MLIDGSATAVEEEADFVVIGSGAAGGTCARWLAAAGHQVVVLEEGPPPRRGEPGAARWSGARDALTGLYRDAGATAAVGRDVLPLLQGRCLGGTTVVNGGIMVPFPEPVWREWVAADPKWRELLPWSALQRAGETVDRELRTTITPARLFGGNGAAMARGLGVVAHPTRRNAPDCRGSGRCLEGCPHGAKQSADVALLPKAMAHGARIYTRCSARRVRIRRGRAEAVAGRFTSGAPFIARARRAVIVAAGAIQSAWLLRRSGVRGAGRNFTCHPGAALAGLLPAPAWSGPGATQSMESLAHLDRGFKLESLGMPEALRAARVPGVGRLLAERLEQLDHVALWGVAARAEARGRILCGPFGPLVLYTPSRADRARIMAGLAVMAEGLLEAGAEEIWPAVHGAPEVLRTRAEARALAEIDPAPGIMPMVATHLFGGLDPGPRFEVAGVRGLVTADSALFPSNLGVNPMASIAAVATLVAEAWS